MVVTPENPDPENVEFVLPYSGSVYKFDKCLCTGSSYIPRDYLFSVRIYYGQYLHVGTRCHMGDCECIYYLDFVQTQLRPCRIAAIIASMGNYSLDDLFILNGVCRGFRIIDAGVADLCYARDNYNSILKGDMYNQMCQTITREVSEGLISPIQSPSICSHSLGAVVRPDGRIRPITDCSQPMLSINDFMQDTAENFKFSHIEDARPMLSAHGFGAVIDISNAYRSVSIYPPHREYVGFSWDFGQGIKYFVDNSLCFGLRSAPSIFNSISRFIVRVMESQNIQCLGYLDDFLVTGTCFNSCEARQLSLINLLKSMGFKINGDKVVTPSHSPKYLGIIVDLINMKFRLPEAKLVKTVKAVSDMLKKTWTSRKSLERLTGLLAHCSVLVRGGRTFCRRLYSLLRATQGKRRVRLSDMYIQDLKWWSSFLRVLDGKCPIFPQLTPNQHFFTDSSGSGFAAWHLQDYLFGFWGQNNYSCIHVSPPPVFNELSNSNINIKELWPVVAGLKKWGEGWRNQYVLLHSDNTQVITMIASGRSRNTQAMCLLREIFWICALYNIDLRATYINTKDNTLADKLSRLPQDVKKLNPFGMPISFNLCCSQGQSNRLKQDVVDYSQCAGQHPLGRPDDLSGNVI